MIYGIIYIATCKITNKSYIGQTIQVLNNRISRHYSDSMYKNYYFANALKKYKKEDWDWCILYNNIPNYQLDNMEIWCIANYDTFNNGYNSDTGGKSRREVSDMTRFNLSISHLGIIPSDSTRQKMSDRMKGNTLWLGKKQSEEHIRRKAEANTGKRRTDDTKMKLSEANSKYTYEIIHLNLLP